MDIYNISKCRPCNVFSEKDNPIPYSCGCVISMGDMRNNYFVYVKDEFMFKRQTMEVYQKTNVSCPNRPSLYFEVAHKDDKPVHGQRVIRFCIDIISFCKQFKLFNDILKTSKDHHRVKVKKVTISDNAIYNNINERLYPYHFDVETAGGIKNVNVNFGELYVYDHIIKFIQAVASSPLKMRKAIDFDICYEDAVRNPEINVDVKSHYAKVYGFSENKTDELPDELPRLTKPRRKPKK
jgi:hypothetical protein